MKLNLKQATIVALVFLCLFGGYYYGYANVLGQIIVAVVVSAFTNFVIDYFQTKKFILSDSAIISGLIIAMVAAPRSPLWIIALLAFIAILSKYLIKINKRSVFNPAALSLLIGVLAFNLPLGWWADYNHLVTIAVGALLLIKFSGRWKMVFTFLGTLTILIIMQSLLLNLSVAEQLYFQIGIAFFFTFFMLTDPKTSPLLPDQYVIFSIIAAAGSFAAMTWYPAAVFIGGLLIANLITPYLNQVSLQKIKTTTQIKTN